MIVQSEDPSNFREFFGVSSTFCLKDLSNRFNYLGLSDPGELHVLLSCCLGASSGLSEETEERTYCTDLLIE